MAPGEDLVPGIPTAAVWVYWPFVAFGFAWIAGHSRATRGLREWLAPRIPILVELIECPGCLGFYIGLLGGYYLTRNLWGTAFVTFATSAMNVVLARLVGLAPVGVDNE